MATNRTLQFIGFAYGNVPVQITARINNTTEPWIPQTNQLQTVQLTLKISPTAINLYCFL